MIFNKKNDISKLTCAIRVHGFRFLELVYQFLCRANASWLQYHIQVLLISLILFQDADISLAILVFINFIIWHMNIGKSIIPFPHHLHIFKNSALSLLIRFFVVLALYHHFLLKGCYHYSLPQVYCPWFRQWVLVIVVFIGDLLRFNDSILTVPFR